jgi:hypothetical protein
VEWDIANLRHWPGSPRQCRSRVCERVANMEMTEKLVYDQLLLNFLYFRSSKDPLTANGFG